VLGWQTEPGHNPDGFNLENLTQPGGLRGGAPVPSTDLFFIVEDIHAAVVRVRELGGTATEPVSYDVGWDATCTDDQGTPFHLSQPAPGY
jgi:predicted enzyme related to lactoylglutathione lyase